MQFKPLKGADRDATRVILFLISVAFLGLVSFSVLIYRFIQILLD